MSFTGQVDKLGGRIGYCVRDGGLNIFSFYNLQSVKPSKVQRQGGLPGLTED